ncbi:hypothetical protein, partial [Mesorhizobium sp. M2D.F.Ca.ET.223.01.1.1]|uniref:hypothetical protein n=1 Tax=Mesorhizobium sp. M2D.F.Ca.ET.223.01.1.1 TaxID=2563940 RepID=UPI001AEDC3DA
SADDGVRVVGNARAIEFDHNLHTSPPRANILASALALVLGVGATGTFDLAERTLRLDRGLFLLRLSDLSVRALLSLGHVRTSFR